MRMLQFSSLCLLSQHERRAFSTSFRSKRTVIQAPNGFGKSAVVKSLYDAFGAEPARIDESWRTARVETLVEFTVDDTPFAILKGVGGYAVFDGDKKLLLRTSSVTRGLTPFLARLLDFQLVMKDRGSEKAVTPPPAYMFAPYYIDQDKGWGEPWSSFQNMYLQPARQVLAEYHSGLKSNAYYEAQTRKNLIHAEIKEIEATRGILHQTLESIQSTISDIVLHYDLKDFEDESQKLLEESRKLHAEQTAYRHRITRLAEERRLWLEQRDLVKAALSEMDQALKAALEQPSEISCPTCGQHYDNSIAEQFALVEDKDGLFNALVVSTEKLHELDEHAKNEREMLSALEGRIEKIKHILGVRKTELSFQDVIAAEGRNEAAKVIRKRIDETDLVMDAKRRLEDEEAENMKAAVSRKLGDEIRGFFFERLSTYASRLDVRLEHSRKSQISSITLGRGSEGPRGRITYYYAFLQTARKYSSSAFCPIVIDAPNQQGQDDMPGVMRFILDQQPVDSQVIIATEHLFGLTSDDADIINVGQRKNQLLSSEDFEHVSELIRPYLGQLL